MLKVSDDGSNSRKLSLNEELMIPDGPAGKILFRIDKNFILGIRVFFRKEKNWLSLFSEFLNQH